MSNRAVSFASFFFISVLFSQEENGLVPPDSILPLDSAEVLPDFFRLKTAGENAVGGMVAYYIWEEDESGKIVGNSFSKPFKKNQQITVSKDIVTDTNLTQQRIISAINQLSWQRKLSCEQHYFEAIPEIPDRNKLYFPLRKTECEEISSVHFRFKQGKWDSYVRKNVVYINVFSDSTKTYSHANDSIILKKHGIQQKAYGHYMIKTFWNEREEILSQQVFNYDGEDVTYYFLDKKLQEARRILVFSNGYRGFKRNRDITDNLITKKDRFHYWMKLDKAFIERKQPDDYFYIDGNFSIATSNHRNTANFSLSYSRIKALKKNEKKKDEYQLLNTNPNTEGFLIRKEKGKLAAKAFQSLRCNSPACVEVKDTIDLVCHSMGYAYALGFIEELKGQVVFGSFYIIAPENACAGGTDWLQFDEVWQYGSNLGETNADPVWQQDGIAPQCEVKDLKTAKKGGRVFLPADVRKKNFVDSHMLKQYFWILKDLREGDAGYVNPGKNK